MLIICYPFLEKDSKKKNIKKNFNFNTFVIKINIININKIKFKDSKKYIFKVIYYNKNNKSHYTWNYIKCKKKPK